MQSIPQNSFPKIDFTASCLHRDHSPAWELITFSSVHAKAGKALMLDCADCSFRLVPLESDEIVILVTNSNVKHELSNNEYGSRRAQCYRAAEICGKPTLRDVSEELLKSKNQNI